MLQLSLRHQRTYLPIDSKFQWGENLLAKKYRIALFDSSRDKLSDIVTI